MWTLVPTAPFVLQMTGGVGREILLFVQSVRLQCQFSVLKISSQAQLSQPQLSIEIMDSRKNWLGYFVDNGKLAI